MYMKIYTTFKILLFFLVFFYLKSGMGPLKIIPGGVQLDGQSIIMDSLRASIIKSRYGKPITFGKLFI